MNQHMHSYSIKVDTTVHNRSLTLDLGFYTRKRDAIRGLARVMKNNNTLAKSSAQQNITIYKDNSPSEHVYSVSDNCIGTIEHQTAKFHSYKFNY